jgi:hypothetical protein
MYVIDSSLRRSCLRSPRRNAKKVTSNATTNARADAVMGSLLDGPACIPDARRPRRAIEHLRGRRAAREAEMAEPRHMCLPADPPSVMCPGRNVRRRGIYDHAGATSQLSRLSHCDRRQSVRDRAAMRSLVVLLLATTDCRR